MRLTIQRNHIEEIIDQARRGYPYEICGLIGGRDGLAYTVVSIPNASLAPREFFEMERQAMIDAIMVLQRNNMEVIAIFHSHPDGDERLSEHDIQQATWPDVIYIVVAVSAHGDVEFGVWEIRDGQAYAADVEVIDGVNDG
jgi:proteasome lid subunit RPN8/RPN11